MSPRCALIFVLFFSAQHALCFSGDPVMYLPPFEVRAMRDGRPGHVPNQQYPGVRGQGMQYPSQSTSPAPSPKSVPRPDKEKVESKNPIPDLVDALNFGENRDREVTNGNGLQDVPRSAYDYPPPPPYGYQRPYGYQPSYGPPHGYHESSDAPPASHHSGSKLSLLKPDLTDLVKPVTTKVAGKVSGLIGLALALLTGSAPNDLELKGFKDIIINGIVKPLLVAKGGIKSLVSKLTIPVISILLINLEVLVTIWWLWEDCPEHSTPPPQPYYPKPSYDYNYNSYQ